MDLDESYDEWRGDSTAFLDDEQEKAHLFSVLDAFRRYRRAGHLNVTHVRRQQFYALPTSHWQLLSEPPFSLLDTFTKVDDAIDNNADIAEAILQTALESFGLASDERLEWHGKATNADLGKVRQTLSQLKRDWSKDGEGERQVCYNLIFNDLDEYLQEKQRRDVRVLVPGAGLSRLVFELAQKGYHAEGNELSLHQLLTSSFILNHTSKAEEWELHPFATNFSNNKSRADQLQSVKVPDVHPGSTELLGTMNMTTGDLCTVYKGEKYGGVFSAVVTLFFIDTAPNLINYITTVEHCLAPGGIWINLGPLLWHFDPVERQKPSESVIERRADERDVQDNEQAGSFELSNDEVARLIEHHGFTLLKDELDTIETGYVTNTKSMLQSRYHPAHWVARKT